MTKPDLNKYNEMMKSFRGKNGNKKMVSKKPKTSGKVLGNLSEYRKDYKHVELEKKLPKSAKIIGELAKFRDGVSKKGLGEVLYPKKLTDSDRDIIVDEVIKNIEIPRENINIQEIKDSVLTIINTELEEKIPTLQSVVDYIKSLKGNDRIDISNIRNGEQLASLASKAGKFDMNDQRWHGSSTGITQVYHDSSLSGSGTQSDPLSVVSAPVVWGSITGTLSDQTDLQAALDAKISSQWVTSGSDIYYNTGNVGIGVTAPSAKLDVFGNLNVSTGVNPTLFVNTASTRVGIGTSTPGSIFEVNGKNSATIAAILSGGSGSYAYLGIGRASVDNILAAAASTNQWAPGSVAGDFVVRKQTAGSILFTTDAGVTTNMIIKQGGNVGIGTTTPTTSFDVTKAANTTLTTFTQDVSGNAYGISSAYVTNGYAPGLVWYSTTDNVTKPKAGIWTQNTSSGSWMFFGTSNNYLTGITNQAISIRYDTWVGINTANPAAQFNVITGVSDFRFSSGSSSVTPTMSAIHTGASGKAVALAAGTGGAIFAFQDDGFFGIQATPRANFLSNGVGASPTVVYVDSTGYFQSTGGFYSNRGNTASTTNLNPGVFVFNSTNRYGMDLGYNNGRYATRISAASGGSITLGFHPEGVAPTAQSSITPKLTINGATYPAMRLGGGTGSLHLNGTTDGSFLIHGTDGIRSQFEILSPTGNLRAVMQAVDGYGVFLQSAGSDFLVDLDYSSGSNYKFASSTGTRGITFAANTSATSDIGLVRDSANVLKLTNGSTGYSSLKLHQITRYNGSDTAGIGVPAIMARGRSTAQTAAVASVTSYTVGASDSTFEVSANVLVTTSTTHSFNVQVAYTDEGNTARTANLDFILVAGTVTATVTNTAGAVPYQGLPMTIRAKAGTSITISTAGTFTTVTYNVEGIIKQLA